jgi:hypothetical protein
VSQWVSQQLRALASEARAKKLEDVAVSLLYLLEFGINHPDAFKNGVTDPSGTIDEGNEMAGRYINEAKESLRELNIVLPWETKDGTKV